MSAPEVKRLATGAIARLEDRVLDYIAQIQQARDEDQLEDAVWGADYYIRHMVKQGYHPVAAEGFRLQARRAAAESTHAQGQAQEKPPGATASGFDLLHFREKLRAVQAILPQYTPAEFARECARMARRSDPRVLSEDEFL